MPNSQNARNHQALNLLGIQTWTLKRPDVFCGEVAIKLEPHIKLIVILDDADTNGHLIINGILNALSLNHVNLFVLPVIKISLLKDALKHHFEDIVILNLSSISKDEINSEFGEYLDALEMIKTFKKCYLIDDFSLSDLREKSEIKRLLWKKLIPYVDRQTA